MKLVPIELAFMFLSNITYPFLHFAINFCFKICFQQVLNFCMSRGQRYRYQQNPPSCIRYQVSDIKHQISSFRYYVSDIKYQISDIAYQISNIWQYLTISQPMCWIYQYIAILKLFHYAPFFLTWESPRGAIAPKNFKDGLL